MRLNDEKKLDENSKKTKFDEYKEQAANWDHSQYRRLRAISYMLWFYSCLSTIAVVALALAISYLTPLKEKEPYLIRVDSSTGIAETLSKTDLNNAKFTEDEQVALDKYFLSMYVRAREGYNYPLRNINLNKVSVMSSDVISQNYYDHVVTTNPQSPINILGRNSIVEVKIKSISFPKTDGEKVAYVRLTRTIKDLLNGETSATEHLLATINYQYVNAELPIEVRQINPLGFQVVAYQLTPEVQ